MTSLYSKRLICIIVLKIIVILAFSPIDYCAYDKDNEFDGEHSKSTKKASSLLKAPYMSHTYHGAPISCSDFLFWYWKNLVLQIINHFFVIIMIF